MAARRCIALAAKVSRGRCALATSHTRLRYRSLMKPLAHRRGRAQLAFSACQDASCSTACSGTTAWQERAARCHVMPACSATRLASIHHRAVDLVLLAHSALQRRRRQSRALQAHMVTPSACDRRMSAHPRHQAIIRQPEAQDHNHVVVRRSTALAAGAHHRQWTNTANRIQICY